MNGTVEYRAAGDHQGRGRPGALSGSQLALAVTVC